MPERDWPPLRLADWQDTRDTLHMWTQIVGKICLALAPPANHFWHAALRVVPCGLRTPTLRAGGEAFEMTFDLLQERLLVLCADGRTGTVALRPRSVADFYAETLAVLRNLQIEVRIWPMPVEVPNGIRFDRDDRHASYDSEYVRRFLGILLGTVRVLEEFRSGFLGKASPAHFFWGSFDLAMTQFSGRPAPERPGADAITREAYSHEVISHGFWPGGGGYADAAFYTYAAPQPAGFEDATGLPPGAYYDRGLSEFLLPYEAMRTSARPAETLMQFVKSTYAAGATLGGWNRSALERAPVHASSR